MSYHFLLVVWCLNVLLVPVTILEFRKLHRLLAKAKKEATLWEEKALRQEAELELLRGPDETIIEEGYGCPILDCTGTFEYPPVEGCTCFQVAPCSACETNHLRCIQCGWAEGDPLK